MNLKLVPGLEAWYSAQAGDRASLDLRGTRIRVVRDLSGKGHTLRPAAGDEGPTWYSDPALGSDSRVLQGDSTTSLQTSDQVLPATGGFHIFIMHRIVATAATRVLYAGTGGALDFIWYTTSTGNINSGRGGNPFPRWNTAVVDGVWQLHEMYLQDGSSGQHLRLCVNGANTAASVAGDAVSYANAPGLGFWRPLGGTLQAASALGEVAIFSRALNAKEQRDVRAHFGKRWNLTITNSP